MIKLLHIALVCSAFAAGSACKNGAKEFVKGTRCRLYAECDDGEWYLKECMLGHIFNTNTLRCESATGATRCLDSAKCEEGRTFSYPGSTSLYYHCLNGRISPRFCRAGEVFDFVLERCRVPAGIIRTAIRRAKRDAVETCKEGSKRRYGKSCKKYVECVNGQEVKKTCSDCMNYDDVTNRCRFNLAVPCSPGTDIATSLPSTYHPVTSTPPITKNSPPATTPQPATSTYQPVTSPEPITETSPPVTSPQQKTKTSPPSTTEPITETSPLVTTPQPTTEISPPVTTTSPTSTVAPCVDGEKIGLVDPECKKYQECKKGEWVLKSCSWMRKFDAIKKECLFKLWHKITCAQ